MSKTKKKGDRLANPYDGSRMRTTQEHKMKSKYYREENKRITKKLLEECQEVETE